MHKRCTKHCVDFSGIEIATIEIIRPDKDKKLHSVLRKIEIKTLFGSTQSLAHKTLLSLVYFAGSSCGIPPEPRWALPDRKLFSHDAVVYTPSVPNHLCEVQP